MVHFLRKTATDIDPLTPEKPSDDNPLTVRSIADKRNLHQMPIAEPIT
jgi:hypothetical protein